jgi:hypothetical protein
VTAQVQLGDDQRVAADPAIGRNRLFVGGGLAYAAGASGYDSIDVHDPAHMQRVGRVDPGTLARVD